MSLPDVAVHVAVGGELHAAVLALVGLVAGVDVLVDLQVLLEGEALGAEGALVRPQVVGRVLGQLVDLEVALVAHELALVALVLDLLVVLAVSLVVFQGHFVGEDVRAELAGERNLPMGTVLLHFVLFQLDLLDGDSALVARKIILVTLEIFSFISL